MHNTAQRYSAAIFSLSCEAGSEHDVFAEFKALYDAITQAGPQFCSLLLSPAAPSKEINAAVELLLQACNRAATPPHPAVAATIRVLAANRHLYLLPSIMHHLAQKELGDHSVVVEVVSAQKIAAKGRSRISSIMQSKFLNKALLLNFTEDPSLLAGLLVRAGDQILDLSLKGRLQRMRNAFCLGSSSISRSCSS